MSAPSPIPPLPPLSEWEQLKADLTQVKATVVAIRRAQQRAAWLGFIKLLFYLAIIGGSTLLLKTYLGTGLGALTNPAGLYDASPSGSAPYAPANFGDMLKNLRELQQ